MKGKLLECPKISFVIPHKDRHETVFETIDTVLASPLRDIQCLVSDTSVKADPRFEERARRDDRLVIVRPSHPLTMTDNFEYAVEASSGDWVVLLGADDGVLTQRIPYLLDACAESKSGVITGPTVDYFWPGAYSLLYGKSTLTSAGRLSWWEDRKTASSVSSNTQVREIDIVGKSEDVPRSILRMEPPIKIYGAGAIRRDVLDAIRKRQGRCFLSPVPDWFLSLAAGLEVKSFDVLSDAVVIQGASILSNGLNANSATPTTPTREEERSSNTQLEPSKSTDVPLPLSTHTELLLLVVWSALAGRRNLLDDEIVQVRFRRWLKSIDRAGNSPIERALQVRILGAVSTQTAKSRRSKNVRNFICRDQLKTWLLRPKVALERMRGGRRYNLIIQGPLFSLADAAACIKSLDEKDAPAPTLWRDHSPIRVWKSGRWRGITLSLSSCPKSRRDAMP